MEDRVTLLCENEGAPIPRFRLAFAQQEYAGQFTFGEEYDRDALRTVSIARLRVDGKDVLPELRDARLLWFKNGIAVVTGVEVLNELNRRRTAQTWKIKTAGWLGPGLDPD